jgi:predicted dehydrogenase
MFDMGPYYLTALLSLLGPVERLAASTSASYSTRTIAYGPREGETIPVNTPTHIIAILDFASGPRASLTTSFDVYDTNRATLVVYGTEGTLRLPDPNTFGGPIELLRAGAEEWEPVEVIYGHTENSRGLGVSDLANSLRTGQPARASGKMAAHIVDIMHAALDSSETGQYVTIQTTFDRPSPLHSAQVTG